jgi:hypothetical protein
MKLDNMNKTIIFFYIYLIKLPLKEITFVQFLNNVIVIKTTVPHTTSGMRGLH